jgi:PAS domain S-box-containing protein
MLSLSNLVLGDISSQPGALAAAWISARDPSPVILHGISSGATALFSWAGLQATGLLTEEFEQWSGVLVAALVILMACQQWRLYRFRQHLAKREELFRIVAENAADMIALVDTKGRRLYNSPAYERVLGYSAQELAETPAFEQIHPEDRFKVLDAAREAQSTGIGRKLEYRIRHKDGAWRILESSARVIKNARGVVEKLVIVNRDVTERKRAEELSEHSSFHDTLTGLPNRRLFVDRLQRSFARAQRNPDFQYAVLFVDLDDFKTLNETLGVTVGDQVLIETSQRLTACLRQGDTVARPKGKLPIPDAVLSRLDGDEFTILLEGLKDPSDGLRVARRIQAAVNVPHIIDGREIRTSASIGLALSNDPHDQPEDLLREADVAMRRAQSLGGSRSEMFDEATHTRATNRLKLESDLRSAIDYQQFQICYQPVVHLDGGQIAGLEALVRWNHPEQGLIPPCRFIEAAESAGLLIPIGRWVLQEACKQLYSWQSRFPALEEAFNLTVNLSAKQFAYAHLADDIRSVFQEIPIEPSRLQFELAESVAMAAPKLTSGVLAQLKQLGVRISIGDFGTGYSSLSWLRRLSIDEVKVDRSLVGSMPSDRASCDIIRLIVAVARELNLRVIAEGIESMTHLERVKTLGCKFGQGYLFSHPLAAEQMGQLLQQQSSRRASAARAPDTLR